MADHDNDWRGPGDHEPRSGQRVVGLHFRSSRATGRLIFGIVLLALGSLWTLDNLGLVDAGEVLRYWPALLVAFGLMRLFGWAMPRTPLLGGILAFVGVQMLLHEFDLVRFSLLQLWPAVLVIVGASIVWRSLRGPGQSLGEVEMASEFSALAIMGGNTRRVRSPAFQRADVSAMMGGVELDLRDAKPAGEQVVIDVFAWWGGIDIIVPDDWKVQNEAIPVMGGIEDNTYAPAGPAATTLVLRGVAIMGGVEVKSASRAQRAGGARRGSHDSHDD
jgi:hypothetical protein